MNIAQIIRQALFDIDAVRQDNTTSPYWTQDELLAYAQQGWDELQARVRQDYQDFGLKFMQSTDGAFRFEGETYAPSSFQLLSTTRNYTLPPDVVDIRGIKVITSGSEETYRFEWMSISHPYFRVMDRIPTGQLGQRLIVYWDIVGRRTLRIANPPSATLDLELQYIARPQRLTIFASGTDSVAVTVNSAAVTGTGTIWLQNALNSYGSDLELIVNTSAASAPKIASQTSGGMFVSPISQYAPISTITSDTALTLAGNWLTASGAGRGYMIASAPPLPEEHLKAVIAWTAFKALRKANSPAAQAFFEEFQQHARTAVDDLALRQTEDIETVEDYIPGGWA